MEWIIKELYQVVRVLAVKIVFTILPTTIFIDCWALFRQVKIEVNWSTEILLPVSIVAFTPLMFLVN